MRVEDSHSSKFEATKGPLRHAWIIGRFIAESSWSSRLLIAICMVVWLICAINPIERGTWLVEQVALLIALLVLYWCLGKVRFSLTSRIGIALLICVHSIGTHYTYSLTPYDSLLGEVFGFSLNELMGWERNHYDRFVHLLYGVALAVPIKEVFEQSVGLGSRASANLSFHLILSTSVIYEFMEWAVVAVFAGDVGMAYLGTQGDIWDAHADMVLAGLGALFTFAVVAIYRALFVRFAPFAP